MPASEGPPPGGGFTGPDIGDLSDHELIEAMIGARRRASQAQAAELAAVAELARRRFAEAAEADAVDAISPRDYVHDEVAEALTLTRWSAGDLIRFATELTERLPATFAALAAGDIDYAKARTLWHGTDQVGGGLIARIERAVLERASVQTTGQIRAKTRRLIRRWDSDAVARRRAEAERQRGVRLIETDAGTTYLSGVDLPAEEAAAAYGRINAIAAGLRRDGDARTIEQLRADVFLSLLRGTLTTTCPPAEFTDRPIGESSTVPDWTDADDRIADAVADLTRAELTALTGDLPERHHNVRMLIAQAGERITASLAGLKARWCVPGHDGSYRPSAAMRRLIEHRDRRCCFPGCRRPVRSCDADHSVPFHQGGPTCPCNVAMLCRRHHRLKQTRGWRIDHVWPGVVLWIGPTGHWRITAPADRE
ncbi:DUF222 domain-containing protein [Actinoallomurus sp. CA-150999]|uniref:HNH endonuclease signature motif containing protein n=1 Tax=Actinoallomurus sp. CA-150999 TaxID=3239887 RepID=UPI003D94AFCE